MRVSVRDLSKEHVWKVANVRSIPSGWKRHIFYDPENENLYGVLVTAGEEYVPPAGHVYIDTFVSLSEFWMNCPRSARDIGLTEEATEEEEEEAICNAYQEVWWDEFEFPVELL